MIRRTITPGLLTVFLLAGLQAFPQKSKQADADIGIFDVSFKPVSMTELSDTITVKFNLFRKGKTDDDNRLLTISQEDSLIVTSRELIGKREERVQPEYLPGTLRRLRAEGNIRTEIPEDYYISVLVDKSGSISQDQMDQIKSALNELSRYVKEGHLFYSWFDENISESKAVTSRSINSLDFNVSESQQRSLYNAVYTKLLEFDSLKVDEIPNADIEPAYNMNPELSFGKDGKKFLIVITNGGNDIYGIDKYYDSFFTKIREPHLINTIEAYKNKVTIYAMSFGSDSLDEAFMDMICKASGNEFPSLITSPEGILEDFKSLGKKIANERWDYELKLKYDGPKEFSGEERTLQLEIKALAPNAFIARGEKEFGRALGTDIVPWTIGETDSQLTVLLKGLLAGLIVFLLVMFIIQLIIPLIRNKLFVWKYVKRYKPGEHERFRECQFCGDPLNPGDKVVVKCKHIVHHLCWKSYDHMCPEYGQNCNDGIEEFFDISDPFSKKNKIYYLSWVLYGMLGGLLSWILFIIVLKWEAIFNFSSMLTEVIRPAVSPQNLDLFRLKIAPLLIAGTLMGFFLTAFFSYVEEYRYKNWTIYLRIFLRALAGAASGFVAFLLGCVILILINMPTTMWFDWIPWVFFGVSIGLIMSVKTTIHWKHGLFGGLISIIFCFIIIYTLIGEMGANAILVGFMFYAAGLGFSIATIRSQSEHFFLKILQGKKNQDIIPVHKWMSSSGGHNEVYLGRSFVCEIQMNWEKNNDEIAQKHAKMYISNRGVPVLISLEKETTTNFNDRFDMEPGKEYQLHNGVRFKIGQTVFQYLETD